MQILVLKSVFSDLKKKHAWREAKHKVPETLNSSNGISLHAIFGPIPFQSCIT